MAVGDERVEPSLGHVPDPTHTHTHTHTYITVARKARGSTCHSIQIIRGELLKC